MIDDRHFSYTRSLNKESHKVKETIVIRNGNGKLTIERYMGAHGIIRKFTIGKKSVWIHEDDYESLIQLFGNLTQY